MEKKKDFQLALMRIVQGVIIGVGAILPGISGGVLAVVFGIYRPMMELLTHPKAGLQKYWQIFLPIIIGWLIGFFGCSGVISAMLEANETIATCVFIGLILGTIPALWKEAGLQGRNKKDFTALAIGFIFLAAFMIFIQTGTFSKMTPDFWGFAFCGVLWGVSLIVPGMTGTSIMMAVGLLEPMTAGIAAFDMNVLIPWLLGLIAVVIVFSRLAAWFFDKHYSTAYHTVFGIVLASTIFIVPLHYADMTELLISIVCLAASAVASYFFERFGNSIKPKE